MAPAAVDETSQSPALDKISKPPPDVVLPPKDIRAIVEKTAGYVARNGVAFEDRIRQKEVSNPKFSFLNPNDAYNPFYAWRLEEIRSGRGTTVSAGPLGEAPAAVPEKPKGPEPPPEFHFSARMPIINSQDFDVVKLTARFVAKHGRAWMTTLSQREANNPQFDFLRPQHRLNQFFSRLVDQFSEILNPGATGGNNAEEARVAELTRDKQDKFRILARAKQRAEWTRFQEQQKLKKEDEAEAEKIAYAQIDWHDFVVVETVLFTEADDEAELPPPTSLADLQSASLEQKAMTSLQSHNMRIEEAMPTDADTFYGNHQQPQAQYQPHAPQPSSAGLPPPPPSLPQLPSHSPVPSPGPSQQAQAEPLRPTSTEPANARPSANAPMKIRSDYIPRAQQRGRQAGNTAICPNCKQPIPYEELDEHIRVELLDPSWKEQRAKADSRYATTNLSNSDVLGNLKRLASQRTDVFDGVTGEPITEEEAARRKKAATSYDGIIGGINDGSVGAGQASAGKAALQQQARTQQMQNMNIEEQLKHIRQKAMDGT